MPMTITPRHTLPHAIRPFDPRCRACRVRRAARRFATYAFLCALAFAAGVALAHPNHPQPHNPAPTIAPKGASR